MKLLVATNNKHKQQEFAQILQNSAVDLIFPQDVGLADFEVDESEPTIELNSLLKAKLFAERSQLLTVADDSGLEVGALAGAPGVKSKRIIEGTDGERSQLILKLLKESGVSSKTEDRQAQFKCVLTLFDPVTKMKQSFTGIFSGSIAMTPSGQAGFGYDPIFLPTGEKQTVAELGQTYKNQHSHRAQAIAKLAKYLEEHHA